MKTDVLVLAAGLSRRFNGNKLMHDYNGKPLLGYCLDLCKEIYLEGKVNSVTVVTCNEPVSTYVSEHYPQFIPAHNPHPENGIASSIHEGLESIMATDPESDNVLIVLGDMPNMNISHLTGLLNGIKNPNIEISVSHQTGSLEDDFRNPVVISSAHYDELLSLRGDRGAKSIIKRQFLESPGSVFIADTDAATLIDVDTR